MKILITGGAGFIGSNLGKHLLNLGHAVTFVDNFSTGIHKNLESVNNIRATSVTLDLTELTPELEALVQDTDIIYHLAGSVGVRKIDSEHHSALMNSININNVLFPLCEKYQKKLIFASTSEVYGECDHAKESDPLNISSPEFGRGSYACAKLMSEFIIKSYTFPSVICRFFNIVGKGQLPDYGMVIPRFVEAAKNGEPLIVHDGGSQVRSFCDITDCVNMLELLINDEHNGEIYNIGNAQNEITMLQLAIKVLNIHGGKGGIKMVDTKDIFSKQFFEIKNRTVCTEKFNKFYKAKIPLDQIIRGL